MEGSRTDCMAGAMSPYENETALVSARSRLAAITVLVYHSRWWIFTMYACSRLPASHRRKMPDFPRSEHDWEAEPDSQEADLMMGMESLMSNSPTPECDLGGAPRPRLSDPSFSSVLAGLALALAVVFLTRLPVARPWPMESDELGFLDQIRAHWFPMHHTLFMTSGRLLGLLTGNPYRGFLVLDMLVSGLALLSAWWWLRALVPPSVAAAGAMVLSVAPVFWGYGAMAGNYTAIVAVGCFLLGVAWRTWRKPVAWHPFAAAVVLALGTGYRQDIGTFWLPVFLVILWKHRWRAAILAGLVFTVLNLAWLLPMLHEVGGWSRYRAGSAEFAYQAGYLNSIWSLGVVDAPVRYAVKLGIALLWTLGPCLAFVPRGMIRLRRMDHGGFLIAVLGLSMLPALASHLLVHFGVPGYAFHYVPALLGLTVLGIGVMSNEAHTSSPSDGLLRHTPTRGAATRLAAVSVLMAGLFLFYPTDYASPGWRGNFDLSFARHTRIGLRTPIPDRQPWLWRTANSRVGGGARADKLRAALPSL